MVYTIIIIISTLHHHKRRFSAPLPNKKHLYHSSSIIKDYHHIQQNPLIPSSLAKAINISQATKAINQYTLIKLLGKGSNGIVLLVMDQSNKMKYALKISPVPYTEVERSKSSVAGQSVAGQSVAGQAGQQLAQQAGQQAQQAGQQAGQDEAFMTYNHSYNRDLYEKRKSMTKSDKQIERKQLQQYYKNKLMLPDRYVYCIEVYSEILISSLLSSIPHFISFYKIFKLNSIILRNWLYKQANSFHNQNILNRLNKWEKHYLVDYQCSLMEYCQLDFQSYINELVLKKEKFCLPLLAKKYLNHLLI